MPSADVILRAGSLGADLRLAGTSVSFCVSSLPLIVYSSSSSESAVAATCFGFLELRLVGAEVPGSSSLTCVFALFLELDSIFVVVRFLFFKTVFFVVPTSSISLALPGTLGVELSALSGELAPASCFDCPLSLWMALSTSSPLVLVMRLLEERALSMRFVSREILDVRMMI